MKVLHLCPIPSISILLWKKCSERISALDWHTSISISEILEIDLSEYDLVVIDDYLVSIAQKFEDEGVSEFFESYRERVLFMTRSMKLRSKNFSSCVKTGIVDAIVHNLTNVSN